MLQIDKQEKDLNNPQKVFLLDGVFFHATGPLGAANTLDLHDEQAPPLEQDLLNRIERGLLFTTKLDI